jgi:hypothetical protein
MNLIWLLWPAVNSVCPALPRGARANNLDRIRNALYGYHKKNGRFPPALIADRNGKPMHSWRTLILPYIDCDDLYKAYDFAEPWNGPHNRKLLAKRPRWFGCPSAAVDRDRDAIQTSYVAVAGRSRHAACNR